MLALDRSLRGILTIARPKIFGGMLEIPLRHGTVSLTPVAAKDVRRSQLKIRYGAQFQTVTLRVPTNTLYETWWAMLANALTSSNFVVLPIIDARAQQITIEPVTPAKRQCKQCEKLECTSRDEIPILETGGPSSLTKIDILASWRTWASLDYFASPPSYSSPLSDHSPVTEFSHGNAKSDSVDSDISDFWSRSSSWQCELLAVDTPPTNKYSNQNIEAARKRISQQPEDDDDWLDEIALFALRRKMSVKLS